MKPVTLTTAQIQEVFDIKGAGTLSKWKSKGADAALISRNCWNLKIFLEWWLKNSGPREDKPDLSEARTRYWSAKAEKTEIDLVREKENWVPRDLVWEQLTARASLLKNDIRNFFYSRTGDLVSLCGGDTTRTPEIIEFMIDAMEVWLGRYSQPIPFGD